MIKILTCLITFFPNLITREVEKGSFYYCSIPLLILNKFTNIQVPEESFELFHFALAIFILALATLGSIFNLILTVAILYYKDKYNLELKFKDYPFIVRIIKYYEKISFITIVYEVIITLVFILIITVMSLMFILNIANII